MLHHMQETTKGISISNLLRIKPARRLRRRWEVPAEGRPVLLTEVTAWPEAEPKEIPAEGLPPLEAAAPEVEMESLRVLLPLRLERRMMTRKRKKEKEEIFELGLLRLRQSPQGVRGTAATVS